MQRSVLVVDDNADVRIILAMRLRQAGFSVTTAADGVEGMKCLRLEMPCCILLDLLMPRMDGFEFLVALRQQQPTPPPVIVISQLDDSSTLRRVRELGADTILTKTQALSGQFSGQIETVIASHHAAAPIQVAA